MPVLLHPAEPTLLAGHYIYNYIIRGLFHIFRHAAFAYTLLGIIVSFIQGLYLKSIATRHKLFPRNTYIPAFVYLLLTSIYPAFSYFNETMLVNWCLLGAVDLMFSFTQTTQPRKLIYNAGFLLCLAALFQFTLLGFFFLLLVAMVMFRPFNLGEWSVAIMGYITPFYFLVSILFLVDRFYLLSQWPHIGFSLSTHVHSPFHLIVTLAGLLIMLASGTYAMQLNVPLSNIYIRRDWTAVLFYVIICMVVAIFTDHAIKSAWMIVMPGLSIIISHALVLEKNRRFSNFIFYFSIIFLIFCLWANK